MNTNILIVDVEGTYQEDLANLLRRGGFDVTTGARYPRKSDMKNMGTALLAGLALTICCGGPLLGGSLSLASLGWLISGPGLAPVVALAGIAAVIVWNRRRRKNSRECDEQG